MGMYFGHNKSLTSEGLGYGYLYNWYAASDANFAPTHWKLPSLAEFDTFNSLYGGYLNVGAALKEAGYTHWNSPNTDATNISGWSALGGGMRDISVDFNNLKAQSYMWTTTVYDVDEQFIYSLHYNTSGRTGERGLYNEGMSVRLLYTGTGTPTTVTDYEGRVYDVVKIGNQYWTVQNWACKYLNDGTLIPNVTDNSAWNGLTTLGRCAYNNDENNV